MALLTYVLKEKPSPRALDGVRGPGGRRMAPALCHESRRRPELPKATACGAQQESAWRVVWPLCESDEQTVAARSAVVLVQHLIRPGKELPWARLHLRSVAVTGKDLAEKTPAGTTTARPMV